MDNLKNRKFSWDFFNFYLSGPMDYDPKSREWRQNIANQLVEIGIPKQNIFDPCKKPIKHELFELDNEAELSKKYRESEDWDGLEDLMSQIAHVDLRLVDRSDVIIAYFPLDKDGRRIYTYGTIHEIVVARQQKKPVFIVWPGGKKTCSGWLMWLVKHKNVFDDFDKLKNHLMKISSGEIPYNAKDWLLLDLDKIK